MCRLEIKKNKFFELLSRIYLFIVLFLYTYSPGINIGELYFKEAIIMLFTGIILYLLNCFFIKKYKILKKIAIFDIFIISIIFYIISSSFLFEQSFITNLNLSILMILIYFFVKTMQFEVFKFGIEKILYKYEFLFDVFIKFMLISTIVAFLNQINMFDIFKIADITYTRRAQSWFNNSTVYGINIAIAINFCLYKYQISHKKNKKKNFILIVWFMYWLISSGGRTGLIMLGISIVIYFILTYKKKGLLLVTSTFFLVMSIYNCFSGYLISKFVIFQRFNIQDILGGRDTMFIEIIDFMKDKDIINQLFGFGTNSYNYKYRNEFTFGQHSGLLKFLFENGIIFLIIYISLILLLAIKCVIYLNRLSDTKERSLLIISCVLTIALLVVESMVVTSMTVNYAFALILLLAAVPEIISISYKSKF